MTISVVQLDGRPASAADLAPLAFAGFAHFTAMQVRAGRVRGLDLHLSRLRSASLELFGMAPDAETILAQLRSAIAAHGEPDLSLTATCFVPSSAFPPPQLPPSILIRTGAPRTDLPRGLRLAVAPHERPLPHIKHTGEVMKGYAARKAIAEGFDDAVFADATGRLTEASIWNLAFWDGSHVVWPEGPKLDGVTMGILRRQLARLGAPQRTQAVTAERLPALQGAVVMNSWTPAVAVTAIGMTRIAPCPGFVDLLCEAYAAEEPQAP